MTLLEAMIALAIMAIVAVVAVNAASQLQSAFSTGQSKGASEQLAAGIRSARQLAITIARDVCLGMGGTSYHYHYGGRSAAACTGANVPQEEGGGVVTLTQGATVATAAFVFTPVSTVDPVGPTSVAVTATNPNTGSTCSVNVTVTAAGGVQLAPPAC